MCVPTAEPTKTAAASDRNQMAKTMACRRVSPGTSRQARIEMTGASLFSGSPAKGLLDPEIVLLDELQDDPCGIDVGGEALVEHGTQLAEVVRELQDVEIFGRQLTQGREQRDLHQQPRRERGE